LILTANSFQRNPGPEATYSRSIRFSGETLPILALGVAERKFRPNRPIKRALASAISRLELPQDIIRKVVDR
jgi:hypothetical protein